MRAFAEMTASTKTDFAEYLGVTRRSVELELDRILPAETIPPTKVHQAIRWSVFAGGKRFRPYCYRRQAKPLGHRLNYCFLQRAPWK